MEEINMAGVEMALKIAFAELPAVHSIELMVNMPTDFADCLAPFRYSWKNGKLYRVIVSEFASVDWERKLVEV